MICVQCRYDAVCLASSYVVHDDVSARASLVGLILSPG